MARVLDGKGTFLEERSNSLTQEIKEVVHSVLTGKIFCLFNSFSFYFFYIC